MITVKPKRMRLVHRRVRQCQSCGELITFPVAHWDVCRALHRARTRVTVTRPQDSPIAVASRERAEIALRRAPVKMPTAEQYAASLRTNPADVTRR